MVYLFTRNYLHYINREVQECWQSSASNMCFCLNIQMLKMDFNCGNSNSNSKKSKKKKKKIPITENSWNIHQIKIKGNSMNRINTQKQKAKINISFTIKYLQTNMAMNIFDTTQTM